MLSVFLNLLTRVLISGYCKKGLQKQVEITKKTNIGRITAIEFFNFLKVFLGKTMPSSFFNETSTHAFRRVGFNK